MSPAGKLLLFSCLSDNLYIHCKCKAMTMITKFYRTTLGFPCSSAVKESTCSARDLRLIPGLGRSAGEKIDYPLQYSWASLVAQLVKNPPQCRKPWFDPWVGMIPPWEGKGCPLQCSGLESSMDCIVTKSQTQLSDFHLTVDRKSVV